MATVGDSVHRNLMINYIPLTWTSAELQAFFEPYGSIEDARVPLDKYTGTTKGYGFVKFVNRQDAEAALEQAQGMEVEGRKLKIQKAELGKAPAGPVNVYLAGFDPATFGMNELRDLFAPYGSVVDVKVHPSQPGKKGVAFVTLESWAEATAAATALNGIASGGPNGEILIVRVSEASVRGAGLPTRGGYAPAAAPTYNGAQRYHPYSRPGAYTPPRAQPQEYPYYPPQQYKQQYQPYQAPAQPTVLPQIAKLPAVPTAESPDGGYTLFVYGVVGMNDAFLYKLFGPFGAITNADAPPGKNFGFVTMPDFEACQNAIKSLNGCILEGAKIPLQVSLKESKKAK